jgi:uncharacterized lipoprotein
MLRLPVRLVVLACALTVLGGCKSLLGGNCNKPQPYQRAEDLQPLKVPVGLEAPDTRNALKIPKLDTPAPPPRGEKDECLESPPKYSVPRQPKPAA